MTDLDRVVPLSPDGTATPLFCVHASSGSAYPYLELARLLGPDRPVYGIEAPGFDGGREPVRSLPALSAEYAATLREFRAGGDVALLGWSLGGIIAFDTAARLTAAGVRVDQVVLVDVSVPWVAELPPEREIVRRFLHDLLSGLGADPTAADHIAAGRPDAGGPSEAGGPDVVATTFAAAERAGVLPAELDAELLAERYAVFRAHVEASYGFAVTEPYAGPVTHLIASDSPPAAMRWGPVAPHLTEHVVPGTHHSIWTGDGLHRLAQLVESAIDA
jgi:thioesterase domain-containing protein